MDEERVELEEQSSYQPRPRWQICLAWIGAGIVLLGFLLYCWQIANGGL